VKSSASARGVPLVISELSALSCKVLASPVNSPKAYTMPSGIRQACSFEGNKSSQRFAIANCAARVWGIQSVFITITPYYGYFLQFTRFFCINSTYSWENLICRLQNLIRGLQNLLRF
jgi:hypothetical protein